MARMDFSFTASSGFRADSPITATTGEMMELADTTASPSALFHGGVQVRILISPLHHSSGAIAQMEEHLRGTEKAAGSTPAGSTY